MRYRISGVIVLMAAASLSTAACELVSGPDDNTYPVIDLDSHVIDDAVRLAYADDAVRLAIRHLMTKDGVSHVAVEPPADLVESLHNALLRVYLLDHSARDAVVDRYRIHTFPTPSTRELLVRIDPGIGWTAAWRDERTETGNPDVDALLEEFDMSVVRFYDWSIGEYVLLRTGRPVYAAALGQLFERIDGIMHAEENGVAGDGADIRARIQDGGWRLDYSIGFGDCPSGCIERHTWSFRVTEAGAVAFLGESGSAL